MNILRDITTAVKLTGEIRKARKVGASGFQVSPVYSLPVCKISYWTQTMEATIMRGGDTEKAVRDVFYALPEEIQHNFTFSPKKGEWAERARFWQLELKPTLPPEMYHKVMLLFIGWYIHCLREKGAVV